MYQRCSSQVIVAPMGGVIDINILAVKCMMDLMGIPQADQDEIMAQVQDVASVVISEQARERERVADKRDRRRG